MQTSNPMRLPDGQAPPRTTSHVPEPPQAVSQAKPAFAVGDLVWVEIGGVYVFPEPRRITKISEHGGGIWHLVEGSDAGVPEDQVRRVDGHERAPCPSETSEPSQAPLLPAPPKRGRGRPWKELRPAAPDPRAFGTVVSEIQAVPPAGRPAAKALATRMVDLDAGVSGAAGKVFRHMLEALKWETGFLFVTNERIASSLGISISSVEKASRVLQARGYVKRQRRPRTGRGGRYDFWRSTIPAAVPGANLLQHLPVEKITALTRKTIDESAALTRKNVRAEPLVDVDERESAASLFEFEEAKAEAAPWAFHLPTEAQVVQFAQTMAAWNGEPVDPDKARSRLRQLLAKPLGGEAAGDLAEALDITLGVVREKAEGGHCRGGSLASYFGQALAGQLLKANRRRAGHEAELAAIRAKADAKVAAEVGIGERRVAAFDAKVASNAGAKKPPPVHPTGRYAVDKDGRQTFNPFAVVRFGFTEIPGKRLADLLDIFGALSVQDIENELADLESQQPIDSNGRRLQLTQNEILAGIRGKLRRTSWHRTYGDPWDRCGGTPYPNTEGDWLAISMEVVDRIAAETGLTIIELGTIFSHLSRQIEEGGHHNYNLHNYGLWPAETWQAHYEKMFENLARQEQAKRAAREGGQA